MRSRERGQEKRIEKREGKEQLDHINRGSRWDIGDSEPGVEPQHRGDDWIEVHGVAVGQ